MGVFSNRVSEEDLHPGDHVYSWRFAYSYAHHGIYVGDGKVIHFTRGHGQELGTGTFLDSWLTSSRPSSQNSSLCQKCGSERGSHGVVLSCLDCFLSGCPLYLFVYGENTAAFLAKARGGTCTLALSDPPEIVLHRAVYLLNNGFGCYHIFRNNCEDFAMYCKTGLLIVNEKTLGTSGQTVSFLGAPLAALCSSPINLIMAEPLGMALVTTSMYCMSRYFADLGNRKDVVKVPVEALAARISPDSSKVLQLEGAVKGSDE
ncbi:hypothetical protein L7F22_006071 [Adiantum nelumboides]|nr:hypothetical protein [Adiantum nelumboides]